MIIKTHYYNRSSIATIKNTDKIVLLKNGNINAIGNFQELLRTSGDFRQMTKLQGMNSQII